MTAYQDLFAQIMSETDETGSGKQKQSVTFKSLVTRVGQERAFCQGLVAACNASEYGLLQYLQFKNSHLNGLPVKDLCVDTVGSRFEALHNATAESQFERKLSKVHDIFLSPERGLLHGHPLYEPFSSVYDAIYQRYHSSSRHRDTVLLVLAAVLCTPMYGLRPEVFLAQKVFSYVETLDVAEIMRHSIKVQSGREMKLINGGDKVVLTVSAQQQVTKNGSRNMTESETLSIKDQSKGLNMSDPSTLISALQKKTLSPNGSVKDKDNSKEYFARKLAVRMKELSNVTTGQGIRIMGQAYPLTDSTIANGYQVGRLIFDALYGIENLAVEPESKKMSPKEIEAAKRLAASQGKAWDMVTTKQVYPPKYQSWLSAYSDGSVDTSRIDTLIEFLTEELGSSDVISSTADYSGLLDEKLDGIGPLVSLLEGQTYLPIEAIMSLGSLIYTDSLLKSGKPGGLFNLSRPNKGAIESAIDLLDTHLCIELPSDSEDGDEVSYVPVFASQEDDDVPSFEFDTSFMSGFGL